MSKRTIKWQLPSNFYLKNQFHTKLSYMVKTLNLLHRFLKRPFPQPKLLIIAQSRLQLKAGDLSSEITEGGKQGQNLCGAVTSQLIAFSWMLLCLFLSRVNVLVNRYIEIKSNWDVHLPDYWKGIHSERPERFSSIQTSQAQSL